MKKHLTTYALVSLALALTTSCGEDRASIPQYTKLAYFLWNGPANPTTNMFLAALDGSNPTPIAIPSSLSSVNLYGFSSLSIPADASFVAFIANQDVWREKADGTSAAQLTHLGNVYWARVSPNGRKIVYNSLTGTSHQWIMNADGTGAADLTATLPSGMTQCYDGSFSADSSMVVFGCSGNLSNGIFLVKTDGSGLKTVWTGNTGVDFPSLTPDNSKVISYGTFGGANGIGTVNIDGTGPTMLLPNVYEAFVLNSSLYTACGNNNQITKSNLDGTSPTTFTNNSYRYDLFWSGGC